MPEPLGPTPVPRRLFKGPDRLDSWKEIASYLSREVRTVQLWEKNEALPIHRHQHARQGSVYAFKSELDDWREARKTIAEPPAVEIPPVLDEPGPPSPAAKPSKVLLIAGLGAVIVVAIVTSIVTGWWPRFSSVNPESLRGVPLTSALGQELEPSLSPEGTHVAYSWNGESRDNFDIYVKLIGPGPPLRLTTNPARDSSPAWSRDGRSIAFLREMPDGKAQVIVIPSLGGHEHPIGEVSSWPDPWQTYPGPHLTWSPDGKGLILSHRATRKEPFALYYVSLDSGQLRKITNPPAYIAGDTGPALSPDGHTLAFRRCAGFAVGQLYLQKVSDQLEAHGEPALLTPDSISAASPAWTPNGRELVYSDGYYFEPVLKRVTLPVLGTGPAAPETLGPLAGAFVTTALHAQKVVYSTSALNTHIFELQLSGKGEGAVATELIASTRLESGAQYSPDGKHIAFLSQRSGTSEIWVCDRDGKNKFQLTSLGDAAAPRWSPDGSQIAFLARYQGLEKIYTIRSTGGAPRQLTTGLGRDHVPSWSRDGRFVYYRSSHSGENEVWKIPSAGGAEVQLTHAGGDLALEGPDSAIYYTKPSGNDWSLWKLTSAGEERPVLPSVYPITNFYVTATGVYFTPHANPDGSTAIQLLRFANGKVETIANLPKPIWFGLSVAPDERSFLYTQVVHDESNLMLVDHFR
ncbi:MAG TPA: hypothetical protein VEU96_14375 [Bryobacteraceae bacterium]|nr:hypothetical protein [Bryobacteraceae bacterium]